MASGGAEGVFKYRKPWGFRKLTRDRVWEGLISARDTLLDGEGNGKPVLLVVDDFAQQMLGSMFTAAEIQDGGFVVLESLELKRQPYPAFYALYFMLPTRRNLKTMIKDFNFAPPEVDPEELDVDCWDKVCPCIFKPLVLPPPGQRYKKCFLLSIAATATETVDKATVMARMAKLMREGVVDRFTAAFKGVHDMFVEYLTPEADLFLLNVPEASLLSESDRYGRSKQRQAELDEIASDISCRLASVCFALQEFPIIRYGGGSRGAVTAAIARRTAARIEYLDRKITNRTEPTGKRPVLLIVDRVEDVVTPLLHDFGYQALSMELPKMKPFRPYKYKHEKRKRKVLLDDQDPVWIALRHTHIATAIKIVKQEHDILYRQQQEVDQLRVDMRRGGKTGQKALAKLAASVMTMDKVLPAKVTQHFNMMAALMTLLDRHSFVELARVEQSLATGRTDTGSKLKPKSAKKIVASLLKSVEIREADKERLFALFWVAANCDGNAALREFVKENLDRDSYAMVSNIRTFGCSVDHLLAIAKHAEALRREFLPARIDETKSDEDLDTSTSRHEPYVANVTKLLLCNELETGDDGFMTLPDSASDRYKRRAVSGRGERSHARAHATRHAVAGTDADESQAVEESKARGTSRRKKTARRYDSTPDFVSDIRLDAGEEEAKDVQSSADDVVIVFITGGITFAETRALNAIAQARPSLRIICGGTTALTPDDFVADLARLAAAGHEDASDTDATASDVDVDI